MLDEGPPRKEDIYYSPDHGHHLIILGFFEGIPRVFHTGLNAVRVYRPRLKDYDLVYRK